MVIIAIDAATKTGFAIYDTETQKILESGVQDFSKRRGDSNGVMFIQFRQWFTTLLDMFPTSELVLYEQAHHRGGAATEICVGLTTRIQEICAQRKKEYQAVKTSVIKRAATGIGNAGKDLMIKAAEKALGRPPVDDNEADAVCLACAWPGF